MQKFLKQKLSKLVWMTKTLGNNEMHLISVRFAIFRQRIKQSKFEGNQDIHLQKSLIDLKLLNDQNYCYSCSHVPCNMARMFLDDIYSPTNGTNILQLYRKRGTNDVEKSILTMGQIA